MFGFGNMFPAMPRSFNQTYRCYPVSFLPGQERHDVEKGGKIIMPPSALDHLTRLNIQYPMLFKLTNKSTNRVSHCGVLEFVADEGRIYIPLWMMHNLALREGDMIQVENVSLPVAVFAKFQPQSTEFLDITNPKAVLENALRSFACLTTEDMIAIRYNDKIYELRVLETKPGHAVSIIECDMNVDFAPPVGYKEPERPRDHHEQEEEEPMPVDYSELVEHQGFRLWGGSGNRLDGKKKNTENDGEQIQPHEIKRGIPNYNYKKGKITFIRAVRPTQNGKSEKLAEYSRLSGNDMMRYLQTFGTEYGRSILEMVQPLKKKSAVLELLRQSMQSKRTEDERKAAMPALAFAGVFALLKEDFSLAL